MLRGKSIDQDLNSAQETRGGSTALGSSPHVAFCPLHCSGGAQAQTPSCPLASSAPGRRKALLITLSWRDTACFTRWRYPVPPCWTPAEISPHVISASCGSRNFIPLDLEALMVARKMPRDLWGFIEFFLPLIVMLQFLPYTVVFIQATFPWCSLSTHASFLEKIYSSGKSRDWFCCFSISKSHTYSH